MLKVGIEELGEGRMPELPAVPGQCPVPYQPVPYQPVPCQPVPVCDGAAEGLIVTVIVTRETTGPLTLWLLEEEELPFVAIVDVEVVTPVPEEPDGLDAVTGEPSVEEVGELLSPVPAREAEEAL